MCLQKKDFITAQALQRELLKRCPGDKVIAEFSKFLPAEIAHQKNDAEDEEEYDSQEESDKEDAEKDGEKSGSSSSSSDDDDLLDGP